MDSKTLSGIKEQLDKERQQIQGKADELQGQLSAMQDDLQRINAALAALDGKGRAASATSSTKNKERKKQNAPSVNKANVIEHIAKELSDNKVLKQDELKERVEKRIMDAGYTRLGFSLRFKEALGESQFAKTAEGIRLK